VLCIAIIRQERKLTVKRALFVLFVLLCLLFLFLMKDMIFLNVLSEHGVGDVWLRCIEKRKLAVC